MGEAKDMRERLAKCACGNLTVATRGEPVQVYACSCVNCQRESGSVFTYSAVYPETTVSIAGERRAWRRHGDTGRWIEIEFCPTCGTTVVCRMESWPEIITVSVGCFADPDFAQPEKLYWTSRHHHWLDFPEGTELIETQPD
jgi:hypothetical protein